MLHTIMMHLVITLSDMKQLKHSQIITKCYTIMMHLIITLSDMKQLKHSQIITKMLHNNDAFNNYYV